MTDVEKYIKDIDRLEKEGLALFYAMDVDYSPKGKMAQRLSDEEKKKLPRFSASYQKWYSEALAVVKQLIPDRLSDFTSYYAPKGSRKDLELTNYTISDALRGIEGTLRGVKVYSPSTALPAMYQQYTIVSGLKERFNSTLYDIKTIVHADLLDDELHAAEVLNKNGFQRGGGAVAGVVLEAHLATVCERHSVSLRKRDPSIADLNEALKAADVIDIVSWRFIQHLGDIRNKCDHKKHADPTKLEVSELIEGVRKITKTVF